MSARTHINECTHAYQRVHARMHTSTRSTHPLGRLQELQDTGTRPKPWVIKGRNPCVLVGVINIALRVFECVPITGHILQGNLRTLGALPRGLTLAETRVRQNDAHALVSKQA